MVLDSPVNAAINNIFVQGYGYLWFTVATAAVAVSNRMVMKWYAVATIWVILVTRWFVGPSLFERLDILAGGWCRGLGSAGSVPSKCADWVSKFDASGHYFLILTMSTNLEGPGARQSAAGTLMARKWAQTAVSTVVIVLLAIWYVEFVVTSLFFHTVAERTVGLVFGVPWWRLVLERRKRNESSEEIV